MKVSVAISYKCRIYIMLLVAKGIGGPNTYVNLLFFYIFYIFGMFILLENK